MSRPRFIPPGGLSSTYSSLSSVLLTDRSPRKHAWRAEAKRQSRCTSVRAGSCRPVTLARWRHICGFVCAGGHWYWLGRVVPARHPRSLASQMWLRVCRGADVQSDVRPFLFDEFRSSYDLNFCKTQRNFFQWFLSWKENAHPIVLVLSTPPSGELFFSMIWISGEWIRPTRIYFSGNSCINKISFNDFDQKEVRPLELLLSTPPY